jgi:hypothetical protein
MRVAVLCALMAVSVAASAEPQGAAVRKTLAELINREDPAWPLIQRAVADSQGRARILPTTRARGERALVAMQYTTRSVLGALAYETGGLAVDHGWLRVLGAGGPAMATNLVTVNQLDRRQTLAPEAKGAIVAVDVLGGVFALNSGELPGPVGDVFYLAPDTLEWQDLGIPYSAFIEWALAGRLDEFYKSLRWAGWQKEVEALPLDKGLHVLPPLFMKRDPKLPTQRKPVPIDELWRFTIDMSEQMRAKGVRPGDKMMLKVDK